MAENITFTVLDVKQNKFLDNYPLFFELRKTSCLCNVAFLSPALLNFNPEYFKAIRPNCDYIVFAGLNMHYFLQLAKPFCVNSSEIVSDIPGLIYYIASYDFSMDISLSDYSENYIMEMLNQDAQLIFPKPIFCYVSNNQYNFFRIHFNKLHPWGRLFVEQQNSLCVKKTSIVLKENIENAMFSTPRKELKEIYEYPGEFFKFHSNTCDYSRLTIGIFSPEVIDSINNYLFTAIDTDLLDEYGLKDRPLSCDDFIPWWFTT